MNSKAVYNTFFKIGSGFYLVFNYSDKNFANDTPLVATKITSTRWGLFEIEASDLVLLQQSVEHGAVVPRLESLRCISIGGTRYECLCNYTCETTK